MLKVSSLFARVGKAMSPMAQSEPQVVASPVCNQVRTKYHHVRFHGHKNYWPQWSMMDDQTRRMVLKNYAHYRLRYNAIRKAEILPAALTEVTDYEIARLPRFSASSHIKFRCAVTSKPKKSVGRWQLSRFVFRHLADYNKLAGVQRGFW